MVTSQITRRKNADTSETLIKRIDKSTLPFLEANVDTMIGDIEEPVYVLRKMNPNGTTSAYVARDRIEFETLDFDEAFDRLAGLPESIFTRYQAR